MPLPYTRRQSNPQKIFYPNLEETPDQLYRSPKPLSKVVNRSSGLLLFSTNQEGQEMDRLPKTFSTEASEKVGIKNISWEKIVMSRRLHEMKPLNRPWGQSDVKPHGHIERNTATRSHHPL